MTNIELILARLEALNLIIREFCIQGMIQDGYTRGEAEAILDTTKIKEDE